MKSSRIPFFLIVFHFQGVGDTTTSSSEGNLISAAAFVEGGIQEACDNFFSIFLQPFCDSDPSTVSYFIKKKKKKKIRFL